jgi:hypothetical protein
MGHVKKLHEKRPRHPLLYVILIAMFLPCSHLSTYTWDLLLTQWVTIGETSRKSHLMGISGWGNWWVLISAVWVLESDTDT